ncbi:MAG TPA: hypothetical protein VFF11_07985 [Candidatus Binatia bacterium]|nr:hypothetical protein [Candidatus Binatia bacterium]
MKLIGKWLENYWLKQENWLKYKKYEKHQNCESRVLCGGKLIGRDGFGPTNEHSGSDTGGN